LWRAARHEGVTPLHPMMSTHPVTRERMVGYGDNGVYIRGRLTPSPTLRLYGLTEEEVKIVEGE
jgi:hypothetical protein